MTISVVISARNEEKNIATPLRLLLSQTRLPDEIFVVCHCCTDRTIEIVRGFEEQFRQKHIAFKVLSVNSGCAKINAIQAGFKTASSDIIASTDADCYIPYSWVEHIRKTFLQYEIDAYVGQVYHTNNVLCNLLHTKLRGLFQHIPFFRVLYGPNWAITQKSYQAIYGFLEVEKAQEFMEAKTGNALIHDDLFLTFKLHFSQRKVFYNPNIVVYNPSIGKRPGENAIHGGNLSFTDTCYRLYQDCRQAWLLGWWMRTHIKKIRRVF